MIAVWFLTLLLPATAPIGANNPVLTLQNDSPTIDRVMFNRASPPADMPKMRPGEAALTRCNYECRAGVRYEVLNVKKVGDHWHVAARIRHVDVETRLIDTIFLPLGVPVLLRAHEEGHREMNERIYKEGETAARAAAADILSHDWEGDGSDPEKAGKAASDVAVQHLCKLYLDSTADRASRLGDIYDRLTDHGRNQLYVANAIRLSFIEEKRQPTTDPGELLHPTTNVAK